MSDPGFWNEVCNGDRYEIGFVNSANLALYKFKRDLFFYFCFLFVWGEHPFDKENVIHYTMKKPWK